VSNLKICPPGPEGKRFRDVEVWATPCRAGGEEKKNARLQNDNESEENQETLPKDLKNRDTVRKKKKERRENHTVRLKAEKRGYAKGSTLENRQQGRGKSCDPRGGRMLSGERGGQMDTSPQERFP